MQYFTVFIFYVGCFNILLCLSQIPLRLMSDGVIDKDFLNDKLSQVGRVATVKIIFLPLFSNVMNRFEFCAKYGMSIVCLLLYLLGPTVMLFSENANLFADRVIIHISMSFFCSICFAENCFVPSFCLGVGFFLSYLTMEAPSQWLSTSFSMTVVIHFLMGHLYHDSSKRAFLSNKKETEAKVFMEKVFDMIPEGILLFDHESGKI